MRFTRPVVCALAYVAAALPAWSQAPRLQFLNRLRDETTVTGAVTVKVSSDPILRPRGIKIGIEVDGAVVQTTETLPWTYVWDSTNAPDGKHVIRLVLVNTRTNETGMIDEMRILTSNRVVPPQQPRDEVRVKPKVEQPREETRREERKPTPRQDPQEPGREPERGRIEIRDDTQPASGLSPEEGGAVVARAANALEFSASSLQVEAGKLLIGRRDGSLTVFDPASRDGWSVKPTNPAGDVLSAARSGDTAAWLCAQGNADPGAKNAAPAAARWLFIYNEKDKKVRSFDLSGAPAAVRRVALWRGQVVLTGMNGGCVLDEKSGSFRDIENLLSGEEVPSFRGAEIAFSTGSGKAVLVAFGRGRGGRGGPAMGMGEMLAWQSQGSRWQRVEIPAISGAGLENVRHFASTTDRIALAIQGGVAGLSLVNGDSEIVRADYPASDQAWKTVTQLAVSGSHVWTVRGTTLYHADLETGSRDAFLPWNIKGLTPQVIAPDGDTLWIGTNQDIKRLSLSKPDPEVGYAGFMRARLGADQDRPMGDSALRLTQEIDAWQGTPYLWGGETRNGVDCSGFVMKAYQVVGIGLSHGSSWLRTCRKGIVVKDELVYGDVLVIPGHCMIYTGDGTTAETVNKAVGRASIWRRGGDVVVRRFLGVSSIETQTFASRSTGYKKAAKPSARKRKSS